MSLAGVLSRAEALQSPVHAGGSYAQAHGREATQVHRESISPVSPECMLNFCVHNVEKLCHYQVAGQVTSMRGLSSVLILP